MATTTHLALPLLDSAQSSKEITVNQSLTLIDAMPASTVVTGAFATRPAAGWPGRLFIPSDDTSIQRDSGSVWARFGPLLPLFDPLLPAFAFTNQGTASFSTTSGSLVLTAPSTANDQLRILDIAVPAAPYTITMGFLPMLLGQDFLSCGLCLRDAAGGGVVTFNVLHKTQAYQLIGATKWTSPTVFSADYALTSAPVAAPSWQVGPCMWLQIKDDNTNRTLNISNDGVNFLTLLTTTRTDFITPTRVGLFVNPNSAGVTTVPAAINTLSWRQQ